MSSETCQSPLPLGFSQIDGFSAALISLRQLNCATLLRFAGTKLVLDEKDEQSSTLAQVGCSAAKDGGDPAASAIRRGPRRPSSSNKAGRVLGSNMSGKSVVRLIAYTQVSQNGFDTRLEVFELVIRRARCDCAETSPGRGFWLKFRGDDPALMKKQDAKGKPCDQKRNSTLEVIVVGMQSNDDITVEPKPSLDKHP
ncbi:hypothetical protein ABZP36_017474 [Zizania latifolia]